MKPSIESWAKKFLSIYHPEKELDFDKSVTTIEFFNCFTLKVFDDTDKVVDYYFVRPEDSKISESSQPFYQKLSKFFAVAFNGEIPRLWIGYIVVDKDGQPVDAQRFSVDPNQIDVT